MGKLNCLTHALRVEYIDLDTERMNNPTKYLNDVLNEHNRKLRLLGRDSSKIDAYVSDLKDGEWMVAFFGPFSYYKFYDPDNYSSNMFISDDQYHFILREDDGNWTQMDYGDRWAVKANIEEEVKAFARKGYEPYFYGVSKIQKSVE